MNTLEKIYQTNIQLLSKTEVTYTQWEHEPILDFATDEMVAKKLGWTGTHSKSLFLKVKGGGFALYLTEKDKRLDSKAIKKVLGKRVSICDDLEMTEQTGCVPGAVCPFALPQSIPVLVDSTLFTHDEILYTPGHPELTLGFAGKDLPILLQAIENTVHHI